MKTILAATSALVLVVGLGAAGPAFADTLLLAAGGGGGGGVNSGGGPGQATTAGQGGFGGADAGAGGMNGAGGVGGNTGTFGSNGGGGGGSLGNGSSGSGPESGDGGSGPPSFAGGAGYSTTGGGFGGGGGGSAWGAGGGGGYSGGGGSGGFGGAGGGGGGSFVNTALLTSPSITAGGALTGNGYVDIDAAVFSYTGAPQTFTAGKSAFYSIEAYGGQGGTSSQGVKNGHGDGGLGALASGDIFLNKGTMLDILVGGAGSNNTNGASGGGGSFVYMATSVPEPGSLGLLAFGLLGLAFVRFRSRAQAGA